MFKEDGQVLFTDDLNNNFLEAKYGLLIGAGVDGDLIIDSPVTLTDYFEYNNLTIEEGGSLDTAGFVVRVANELTINGEVNNNYLGASGSSGAPTPIGGGGDGGNGGGNVFIFTRKIKGEGSISVNGGDGTNGSDGVQSPGGIGPSFDYTTSLGPVGGNRVHTISYGTIPNTGGGPTNRTYQDISFHEVLFEGRAESNVAGSGGQGAAGGNGVRTPNPSVLAHGGRGGGGASSFGPSFTGGPGGQGAGSIPTPPGSTPVGVGGGAGGGGGGAGGLVFILSLTVDETTNISVQANGGAGGDGGNPGGPNSGGGGGGSGGSGGAIITLIPQESPARFSFERLGGAGGAGKPSGSSTPGVGGTPGTAASEGVYLEWDLK